VSIRVRDYLLAVEDAQLARLAAPRDPRGCSLEGAAQLGLGEVVRARECFLAGLQLDPRSQFMQSGLKATRQMLGDVSPELAEDPELEQV
jgi:Flp pilus assembly protein TadD